MPYYDLKDLLVIPQEAKGMRDERPIEASLPSEPASPEVIGDQRMVFHIPWTTKSPSDGDNNFTSIVVEMTPTIIGHYTNITSTQELFGNISYAGEYIPGTEQFFPLEEEASEYFNTQGGANAAILNRDPGVEETGHLIVIENDNPSIFDFTWAPQKYNPDGGQGKGFETITNKDNIEGSYHTTWDIHCYCWTTLEDDEEPGTGGIISYDADDETGILTITITNNDIEDTNVKTFDFSEILDYGKQLTDDPLITGTFEDFTFEFFYTQPATIGGRKHLWYNQNEPTYATSDSFEYDGTMVDADFGGSHASAIASLNIKLPSYVIQRHTWPRHEDLRPTVEVGHYTITATYPTTPFPEEPDEVWTNHDQRLKMYPGLVMWQTWDPCDNMLELYEQAWIGTYNNNEKAIINFTTPFPNYEINPNYFDNQSLWHIWDLPSELGISTQGGSFVLYCAIYVGCAGMDPIVSSTTQTIVNGSILTFTCTTNAPEAPMPTKSITLDFSDLGISLDELSASWYYIESEGDPPNMHGLPASLKSTDLIHSVQYNSEMHTVNPLAAPITLVISLPDRIIHP